MKIVLAGYGAEGESSFAYFRRKYPHAMFAIYDERETPARPLPEGVEYVGSPSVFNETIQADLVVRTPSLPPTKLRVSGGITTGTNEFLEQCPAPVIGVTGTKGKGTTASFIMHILQAAGRKVWLVGNIGTPALDVLNQVVADDIVVYEMSSFQLWDACRSPQVAVVLGIEPDHLDVHESYQEYVEAKANIARYQNAQDTIVYNAANDDSAYIASLSASDQRVGYGDGGGVSIAGDVFLSEEIGEVCPLATVALPGAHNLDNACAAIAASLRFVKDPSVIRAGLGAFKGLAHRLAFVQTIDGVDYFDDSISTTPGSAIAALRSFPQPKVIILGGSSKGGDFAPLVEEISHSHGTRVLLVGEEIGRAHV